MKMQRYGLMLTLTGMLLFVFATAAQVFAIGIKTSSTGCKVVNDKLSNSTTLKVDDNGKVVVVATGYYFDKDDQILLEWSAVDNNGQYLKSTGGFVLPADTNSTTDKTGASGFTIKADGSTNLSIKITIADTTNLKSISYKISCTSAYTSGIISMPQPLNPPNPIEGFSTLPTLTPPPPLPTLVPLPTMSP